MLVAPRRRPRRFRRCRPRLDRTLARCCSGEARLGSPATKRLGARHAGPPRALPAQPANGQAEPGYSARSSRPCAAKTSENLAPLRIVPVSEGIARDDCSARERAPPHKAEAPLEEHARIFVIRKALEARVTGEPAAGPLPNVSEHL